MAKIRVYELAKDLKMTNKALLSKMKELKIEVKSHMSSLQDSDISKIKKKCLGKPKKKKRDVEIKPSVIRRRKQTTEELVDPEVQETAEIEKETEPEQEEVIKKKKSAKEEKKLKPAVVPDDKSEESERETSLSEPEKVIPKSKKKKSKPAKIVKPLVTESVESEPEPEPESEKIDTSSGEKKKPKAVELKAEKRAGS